MPNGTEATSSPDNQPEQPEQNEESGSASDLKALVERLSAQHDEALKQLAALKAQQEKPPVTRLVIPRERKLRRFSGSPDSSLSVDEFVEEAVSIFQAREMPPHEALDLIVSHLDSPAKDEVKLHPASYRNTAKKIIGILKEAFGEKRSLPQLMKSFYDRKQKSDETLMEYSHALRDLFSKVTRASPSSASSEDKTLRDQFVEHVRESFLRRELKKLIRGRPDISFLDVREEALHLAEDDTADHVAFVDKVDSSPRPPQPAANAQHSDLQALLAAFTKQQEDIAALTKAVNDLQSNRPQTNQSQGKRNITCYNCQRQGHVARKCRFPPMQNQSATPYANSQFPNPSQATAQNPLPPQGAQPDQSASSVQATPFQPAAPNMYPLLPGAKPQGAPPMAQQ